jgi:MerR family transcriptional regulator, copper efflux regulator
MRISELSAKTQVSVLRLRRYEADGLIQSQRLPNGYRVYDEKTVKHVIFIAMSREMGFSLSFIAGYLPRFKTGKLSAKDMIDAILVRVAEIDQIVTEQKALRQKLMDHIGWFKTQARRKP